MIRLVIFDWSGVISDDSERAYRKIMAVLESFNRPTMTFEEWKRSFYLPWVGWYAEQGVKVPVKEIRQKFKAFESHFDQTAKMIPGAKEVLEFLKGKGIKLAVLSTCQTHLVRLDARAYGIEDYFDGWQTQITDKRDSIKDILNEFKVSPEETIYVGDMVHDIETGKFAGVKVAACTFGYTPRELLLKHQPDFVLEKLSDLKEIEPLKG